MNIFILEMKEIFCLKCKKELGNRQKYYCSNLCKLTHREGIEKRNNKKEKQDSGLEIICNIDGKSFSDIKNYSGVLTRHLKKLGYEVNNVFDYYTIKNIKEVEKYQCKYCDWKTIDLSNKSGCITNHLKKYHDINPSEHIEKFKEDEKLWIYAPNKEIRDYLLSKDESNYIECKECSKKYKRLTITHLKLHGLSVDDYRKKWNIENLSSKSIINKMKDTYSKNYDLININIKTSKMQEELYSILITLGVKVNKNNRSVIRPLEIDLYLPDYKIAIEMNGLYWHSEIRGKKAKDYHLNKVEKCEAIGVKLIQIFEDDWHDKKHIVIEKIKSAIGFNKNSVYARKCQLREITSKDKTNFLNSYHIQGVDRSPINIGLFQEDDLVAVMTFCKLRKSLGQNSQIGSFELCRYATKTRVVGGASKCLSYFIKKYSPSRIITYADRKWTSTIDNNLYDVLGFKKIGTTKPGYWYTKDYRKKVHRFNFTKSNILKKFDIDKNKPEIKIMSELGYDRIWDCGNIKYEMNF
jgi:G:T-mismatch repair DNA endonuclease (very short patch repair protein)